MIFFTNFPACTVLSQHENPVGENLSTSTQHLAPGHPLRHALLQVRNTTLRYTSGLIDGAKPRAPNELFFYTLSELLRGRAADLGGVSAVLDEGTVNYSVNVHYSHCALFTNSHAEYHTLILLQEKGKHNGDKLVFELTPVLYSLVCVIVAL